MLTKTKEEKYQENLKKVKEDPFYLRFIPKDEQTEAICLEAVRQSGFALEYVQEQTEAICLEAVRQDGRALQFVQQQTEEICLSAVQENGRVLEFVQQQTEEICLAAVRQEGYALKYAKNPFKELCVAAIKQNPCALEDIPQKWKEEVARKAGMELFYCENRTVLVEKIDHQWVFTVGCQVRITKETFIQRIHEEDGGLAENPHRQEYLDILEQF